MGEATSDPVPEWFAEAFLAAAGPAATLRFDRFAEIALYHPTHGYYRQTRRRVGREEGTDFYTATTSSPVFGDLIAAACVTLLEGRSPGDFRFVEIGAEPGGGVLGGVDHPFAEVVLLGAGQDLRLEGPCVVFSNELFDAQPFRRFARRENRWQEVHASLAAGGSLSEVELPAEDAAFLPDALPDGYRIDAPVAAEALANRLAEQPWRGLFLAFDYGKSWAQLVSATPNGTARAYRRHRQHNDLLANPGDQDLTCHVCWDWLAKSLTNHRFSSPRLESQEAFFVRWAAGRIESLMRRSASGDGAEARSLTQLLHPAYLGQKFEVLHATRFA